MPNGNKNIHNRDTIRAERQLLKQQLKTSVNAEEILMIKMKLGITTMQELLGDKYPIRICMHCGRRAYNSSDLVKFKPDSKSRHGHRNECVSCTDTKDRVCMVCNRLEPATTSRNHSFFYWTGNSPSRVCKVCLGTHEEVFGKPYRITKKSPSVTIDGIYYSTIAEASRSLQIPYSTIRNNLMKGIYHGKC
jgi:hypothetical protein